MTPVRYSRIKLLIVLCFFSPGYIIAQEVRGLKIYVDVAAGTYLKFQKPIDGIEGTFREKGYNFKNRSGGNALNIIPPTDRSLEQAEIEISEGGRNHLFIITPYPKKYDPNIDPPFDYILDNSDKVKKFAHQAEQERQQPAPGSTAAVAPPQVIIPPAVTETQVPKQPEESIKKYPSNAPPIVRPSEDDGYNAKIDAGDKAFLQKDYYNAKLFYTDAYRIRLNEKYPLSRIQLITKLEEEAATKAKLEEEQQKAIDANYASELQKADRYLLNNEYSLARATYTSAAAIKSQEPYPKNKIQEIDKTVKDLLAKQEEERAKAEEEKKRLAAELAVANKYNEAVARADKAFSSRQYDVARLAYSDALKIKPGEKYPDDKLVEIAEIKNTAEAAAAEKIIKDREKDLEIKYNGLIAQGDKAFSDKQFEQARKSYNAALSLKPSDNTAPNKLADIESELNKIRTAELEKTTLAKQKQVDDNYNAAIQRADKAFAAKNFETAKTEYYNAQALKPGESYPQSQLTIIDNKVAETAALLVKEKEAATKYNAVIINADNAFKNKDYDVAKTGYNNALELKSGDVYARGKISAIEKIAADIALQKRQAAEKELNMRFETAMAAGDKAYNEKNYSAARTSYENALQFMPDKVYPANQIKLIDHKLYELAEQEKTRQFNSLIALADQSFNNKAYDSAKIYYTSALSVRPDEFYPKNQVELINDPGEIERIGKREELRKYNLYVNEGDKAFKAGKLDEAKESYKKAAAIKPDVPYVVVKLNEVETAIADVAAREKAKKKLEEEKVLEEKFNALVLSAGKASDLGEFEKAKSIYNEALTLKPNDQAVNENIRNVDKRIAKAAADAAAVKTASLKEQESKEEFSRLTAKADKSYDDKKFDSAKADYENALLLKPDDEHTRSRLTEIEKNLEQLARAQKEAEAAKVSADEINNNYNAAIERANKALEAKLYYEAKAGYNDALALKPKETLPAQKLKEIEKALVIENEAKKPISNPAVAGTATTIAPAPAAKKTELQKDALPYSQAELFKRYNTINFREPPYGQKLTADAFFVEDTLENFNISNGVMAEPARLDISDSANNVVLTLQGISFEGSNAYFKFRIQNFGTKEYLAGKMLLTWHRKDGTTSDYYGSYITSYPYVLPGKEFTVVYATRAATLAKDESFRFVLDDRLKTTVLEIGIPAEVYTSEYER
ncbi:hypothetical protein BH10BAC3_BH10BAC3_34920 [soil metagenome]